MRQGSGHVLGHAAMLKFDKTRQVRAWGEPRCIVVTLKNYVGPVAKIAHGGLYFV